MSEIGGTGESGGIWSAAYLPVTLANLTIVAVAAFDGLAIVAALPNITEDLGSVALAPWVITSFLATSAVSAIIAGPVIDAVGVRRTFRLTGIWFLLTSAAAAAAPTMPLLIAARVLQGFGGGLVIAVALSSVGLAYPHRLRPRAFAVNSMVWGTMGFGGPAIAAVLLTIGGWRGIFLIQLPLTGLALAMGWNRLPSTRDRPGRVTLDGRGILLLSGVVGASLFAVAQVGVRWWLAGVALLVAAGFGAAYWAHSGSAKNPVLARRHLQRFPLSRIHLTSGLILIAGLAADNYLPLYVQTTRGRSESLAAFSVVPLTVGWTAASFLASRLLDNRSEADVILLGAAWVVPSVAVGGIAVASDWPLAVLFVIYFSVGLGIGFVSTAGLTLLQSTSDESEMGRSNSSHQFIRTLCITYGVAMGGAILLLVVDLRIGDVEAVREVLSGDDVTVGGETSRAIGAGLAWVHVLSVVAGTACLLAALSLRRQSSSQRG